jgi:hypothetical protein
VTRAESRAVLAKLRFVIAAAVAEVQRLHAEDGADDHPECDVDAALTAVLAARVVENAEPGGIDRSIELAVSYLRQHAAALVEERSGGVVDLASRRPAGRA